MDILTFINQASGQISAISADVMTVLSSLFNIILLMTGARIIYGIIKGETARDLINSIRQKREENNDEGLLIEEVRNQKILK